MASNYKVLEARQQYVSKDAFGLLYEETNRPVYRYVYGLIGGSQQEVEDITAETFLKAWDARKRFSGDRQQATSWLFTIAKRIVIDRWRKQKVRPQKVNIEDMIVIAGDASPEERASVMEQSQILVNLLYELTDEKREIVVLRYILNWSVNSIAEHLGKKPNTISVTIRRVLQELRDNWTEHQEGEQ